MPNIKKWIITGDTHGDVAHRIEEILVKESIKDPEETALIILGDAGLNYHLNLRDIIHKSRASAYGISIYCVYGNHEQRPSLMEELHMIEDENVGGTVWIEDEFPLIRYFCEWGHYNIAGKKTLIVGGAYSVDKPYRLESGYPWFEGEQLKDFEKEACERSCEDEPEFDLILSHTCPYSWRPTDLFLDCIDQSTIDNSMERWLEKLKNTLSWKIWLFGHYHGNRIIDTGAQMLYHNWEYLDTICNYWKNIT